MKLIIGVLLVTAWDTAEQLKWWKKRWQVKTELILTSVRRETHPLASTSKDHLTGKYQ